jgi:hypothetical protein
MTKYETPENLFAPAAEALEVTPYTEVGGTGETN